MVWHRIIPFYNMLMSHGARCRSCLACQQQSTDERWPNVVAIVTRARILRKCFAFPLNKCVNGVCSYMPVDIIYVPESAEECWEKTERSMLSAFVLLYRSAPNASLRWLNEYFSYDKMFVAAFSTQSNSSKSCTLQEHQQPNWNSRTLSCDCVG